MTESKDMYRRAFEVDWKRLSAKKDFFKTHLNINATHEFDWIKRAIVNHYPMIFSSYLYYACTGGGDSFTMSEQELRKLLMDVKMLRPMSTTSTNGLDQNDYNERLHHEISLIFIQTNIEERVDSTALQKMSEQTQGIARNEEAEAQNSHNMINPDRGLMRFEYLEALLRIAAFHWDLNSKYRTKNKKRSKRKVHIDLEHQIIPKNNNFCTVVRGGKDLPDAFNDMCERYFVPNLPERSTIRHDVWRIRRLYTLELDTVITKNKKWLIQMFKSYCDYSYGEFSLSSILLFLFVYL